MLFLSLFSVTKSMVMSSFEEHELEHILENIERASNAVFSETESLEMIVNDWAVWNDTYDFMNDRNPEYLQSNTVNGTFEGLLLNLMIYVNLEGSVVFAKTYDLETNTELEHSVELQEYVMANAELHDNMGETVPVSGFVFTDYGVLIVSSRAIQDSEGALPPNGFMIIGRQLDDSLINRIENSVLLNIDYSILGENQTGDFLTAADRMTESGEHFFVQLLDGETIAGYALVNDIRGAPLLVLRTDMYRSMYLHTLNVFNYFQFFLMAVMVVIGSVTLMILEFLILKRLSRLDAQVNALGVSGARSSRVKVAGNDEITMLASNINGMLDARERTEAIQEELNTRLNQKVAELEDHKKFTVNRELRMIEIKNELHILKSKIQEAVAPAD